MADRIIKPDSGNDVVIQNNGGTRKIEVTNTGDVEVTGDFKATTVKATNIKANDGTASLEVADSTGDIGFSGNTNLKIKLPSAGGIHESDGSTEILTESSGAVTLKNTTIDSTVILPSGTVINVTTMRLSSGSTWDLDNVFSQSSVTNGQRYNTTNFFKVTPSKSGNTFVIIGNFPIGFNNSSGGDAGLTLELSVTVGSGSEQFPSSLSTDAMLGNNHSIYQNSGSTDFIFPFAHTYYYTTSSTDVHSFGINLKAYSVNQISFNNYNNRAIVNVLEVQS